MEGRDKINMAKVILEGLIEDKVGRIVLEKNSIIYVEGGTPLDNVGQKDKATLVAIVKAIILSTNAVSRTKSLDCLILWLIFTNKLGTI